MDNNSKVSPMRRFLVGAALLEGSTLLFLVTVAVPLKHLWGYPQMVSWFGPVHGVAFILYIWTALNVAMTEGWDNRRLRRVLAAAFIPLGGFVTVRSLIRSEAFEQRK